MRKQVVRRVERSGKSIDAGEKRSRANGGEDAARESRRRASAYGRARGNA